MKTTLVFSVFISLLLIFTACSDKNKEETKKANEQRSVTSEINGNKDKIILKDTDNNTIEVKKTDKGFIFSDAKGKAVLINFFATWCPPCKAEIPHLNNLQEKYKDKLKIIGILLEENKDNEEVQNFINYHDIVYTVTNSRGNFQLAKTIGGVQSIPFMILYDKNGDYVTHYLGAIPEEMIDADIQRVIK